MKEIGNYKYSITEATKLANRLASQYSNPGFYDWYCKVIKILGINRVTEIEASVRDCNYPGHVFSIVAKEEMSAKRASDMMSGIYAKRLGKDGRRRS